MNLQSTINNGNYYCNGQNNLCKAENKLIDIFSIRRKNKQFWK